LKKLLVIGKGFLGTAVSNIAKINKFEIFEASQKSGIIIDIRKSDSVEEVIRKINPDIIMNCAASTDLDRIENNPKNAFDVNAYGSQIISKISKKYSKRLIHISTDSVFDGDKGRYKENDIPNPINQYSKSKLEGEKLILNDHSNAVIVRTNFYGYNNNKKFLFNWILKKIRNNESINAFDDIIFNPLEISNLSKLLLELSLNDFKGVLHLTGNEIFSKYEFVKKIACILNYDEKLVIKGNSEQMDFMAKRPKNTSLDNSLAKKILKTEFQTLEEWLTKNYKEYGQI
jgi:dTDP-4-dehydrorhamnose reductase